MQNSDNCLAYTSLDLFSLTKKKHLENDIKMHLTGS